MATGASDAEADADALQRNRAPTEPRSNGTALQWNPDRKGGDSDTKAAALGDGLLWGTVVGGDYRFTTGLRVLAASGLLVRCSAPPGGLGAGRATDVEGECWDGTGGAAPPLRVRVDLFAGHPPLAD